jgi:uncharacterized membrane protein YkoI
VSAEKIAVAKVQGNDTVSIASAELEAEHRRLIWSFDLRVAGHSGIQEVQVDAGDGKVLSRETRNCKPRSNRGEQRESDTS